MSGPFGELFRTLVKDGALPVDKSGRKASPTIIVQGFRGYQMLLAQCTQLIAIALLIALFVPPSSFPHLRASHMAILDRLEATGLDVSAFTTADFYARLRYSPEDGQALVSMSRVMPIEQQLSLAGWLKNTANPAVALTDLTALISATAYNTPKWRLVQALAVVSDKAALALAGVVNMAELIEKVAALTVEERILIVQTGFPLLPKDRARAQLITSVMEKTFPADLAAMIDDLRHAHPDRMTGVRDYLRAGTPLSACKAVACTPQPPSACYLNQYHCPAGFYATMTGVQCTPTPPGMTFSK